MSLQDDLLRNRKIFALLTESEGGADAPSAPLRKSMFSSDSSAEAYTAAPFKPFSSDSDDPVRQNIHRQTDMPQSTEIFSPRKQTDVPQNNETFSLKFGRRVSRETGMSLNPPVLEDIAFPTLQKAEAPTAPDPLEGLYHRLECDARRASQLLGEEDY